MVSKLSRPLVCLTALAVYLAVNLGAGAVHHHHPAATHPAEWATAPATAHQPQATNAADDEEDCLLCNVLHLAQSLPATVQAESVLPLTGRAAPASALHRPYPLETPPHSRGPPLV